jgi:hypothetical protein
VPIRKAAVAPLVIFRHANELSLVVSASDLWRVVWAAKPMAAARAAPKGQRSPLSNDALFHPKLANHSRCPRTFVSS